MGCSWNVSEKEIIRGPHFNELFDLWQLVFHDRQQPLMRVYFAERVSRKLHLEDHESVVIVIDTIGDCVSPSIGLANGEALNFWEIAQHERLTEMLEALGVEIF